MDDPSVFILLSSIIHCLSVENSRIADPASDLALVEVFQQRQRIFTAAAEPIAELSDGDAAGLADLGYHPLNHRLICLGQESDVGASAHDLALLHQPAEQLRLDIGCGWAVWCGCEGFQKPPYG